MKWHENGRQESETEWKDDLLVGSFLSWHPNGAREAVGQTKDGEVDGEWKSYYASGRLAETSHNRTGRLIRKKVWLPDGSLCERSNVENGNGAYNVYEENGTVKERRVFRNGVQIKETTNP